MGVPAFFGWLRKKYPSIVVHCCEEKPKSVAGVKIPVDTSKPNPNNFEFHNLYLDLNGIIHPCCHPENKVAPKNEDEMMVAIFEYIDRIFSIVRPRRLLYMAIDGVAPRAKMNQQRSRRFRAAKEGIKKVVELARLRDELTTKGCDLPPEKKKEEHFDSNCITPGTPFMDRLAKCLHYYIHNRLNNDPGWRDIEVILSDANVPGEGEHKIMDFIRRQRSNPDHDANTRHCLCGADADFIMLGLATHEPNFTIIREVFKPNQPRPCELCGQYGHKMKDCCGLPKEKEGEFELPKPIESDVEFIFIRLNVLREYLAKELVMPSLPFPYDFERAVDDWVFMCFFVGNDFLPHLPSLEIREGAIDRLVNLYKDAVYKTGGYVTDSGRVNLERVQVILTELGNVEDEIFKRRQDNELAFKRRQKDRRKWMKRENDRPAWTPGGQFSPQVISSSPSPVQNARHEAYQMRMMGTSPKNALAAMMKPADENNSSKGEKRKHDNEDSDEEPEPVDHVRLWEDGWKDRYYEIKFEVARDNIAFRHKVAAAYVEGLCWVLSYYYQGCATWKWFFPYHYAPFASDFVNVGDIDINFERATEPFKPLEQLMGVFPAASRSHVPEPWGKLMTDPESPIIDFYPNDFKVDLNGKKYAWQGVALLPFVDEKRLLKALAKVYPLLTDDERRRNVRGSDRLYVRKGHKGYDYLLGLYENNSNALSNVDLDTQLFYGMGGKVKLASDVIKPNETIFSPVIALPDVPKNNAVCIKFVDPQYPDDFIFPAIKLENAVDPPKVLKPTDNPIIDWRAQAGMAPARQRAYLDNSGHRMLNHSMNSNPYNEIPPPSNYGRGWNHRDNNRNRPPHAMQAYQTNTSSVKLVLIIDKYQMKELNALIFNTLKLKCNYPIDHKQYMLYSGFLDDHKIRHEVFIMKPNDIIYFGAFVPHSVINLVDDTKAIAQNFSTKISFDSRGFIKSCLCKDPAVNNNLYSGNSNIFKKHKSRFSCSLCLIDIESKKQLKNHFHLIHKGLSCPEKFCYLTSDSKWGIKLHDFKNHKSQCPNCRIYLKKTHKCIPHPFKCNKCSLQFTSRNNLIKHRKKCNADGYYKIQPMGWTANNRNKIYKFKINETELFH